MTIQRSCTCLAALAALLLAAPRAARAVAADCGDYMGFELKDGKCAGTDANGTTTVIDPKEQQDGLGIQHVTNGDLRWDSYYIDPSSIALARQIVKDLGSSNHAVDFYGWTADGKHYVLNMAGQTFDASGHEVVPPPHFVSYQVNAFPDRPGYQWTSDGASPAAGSCGKGFTYDEKSKLCTLVEGSSVYTYSPDTSKWPSDGAVSINRQMTMPDGKKVNVTEYFVRDAAALAALQASLKGQNVTLWALGPDGKTLGQLGADGKIHTLDGKLLDPATAGVSSYQAGAGAPAPPVVAPTPPVIAVSTRTGFCDPKTVYNVPSAQCVSKPQVTNCGNDPLGGTGNGTGMGPFGGAACCDDSVCMTGFQCVFTRSSQTASEVRGQCQARSAGAPWNDPKGIGRPCSADDGCLSKYCNPRLGTCATRPLARENNPLVKGVYGMACENSDQCYVGLQCGPDKFCQWGAQVQRPGVEGKPFGKCGSDKDCPAGTCNSITMTCGATSSACTRNEDCDQARGMRCMQFSCQQDLKTKTEMKITGGTLPPDAWGNPQTYCGANGQDDCFRAGIAGKQCYMNICRNYDFEIGLSPAQQKVQDAYAHIRGQGLTASALLASANPMGMCPGVSPYGGELKGTTGDPKKDKELVEACGAGSPEAGDLVAAEAMRVGKLLGISGIKCGRQVSGGGPFAWYVVNCDIPGCTDAFTRNGSDDNARHLLGRFVDGSGFKDPGNCNLTAQR